MSILVLTLLCVYVHYNVLELDLYIKLFALYKNIFFMKVIKTEIRFKTGFQQPKTGFPKNPVLTSLLDLNCHIYIPHTWHPQSRHVLVQSPTRKDSGHLNEGILLYFIKYRKFENCALLVSGQWNGKVSQLQFIDAHLLLNSNKN